LSSTIESTRRVEDLRTLDEDAELRGATGSDEQRGRRRQAERAGARDDEDGDGGGERELRSRPCEQPAEQGQQREPDDDGDEHGGDPVGEALDRGLAGLGVEDEPGHLGELGVRPHTGRSHDETSTGVDGRTHHVVAGSDLDRDGLTREHGGVDRGRALDHDTVGRDLLPRPHHEQVADGEVSHRDAGLEAVAQQGDVLGAHGHQGTQRGTGPRLGARLEVAAGEDEDGHGRGDLEVHVGTSTGPVGEQLEAHRRAGHPRVGEEQRVETPGVRRPDAEADQRVHRRGPVPQVHPRGPVEGPRAPHDDGRREGQRCPLPVGELQRGDHRHEHDGHGQSGRDRETLSQRRELGIGRRLAPGLVRGLGRRRLRERGRVPGGLDGRDDVGDRHVCGEDDPGHLGGVVHLGGDPRHLVELALDAGRARRARHAADGQVDRAAGRLDAHGSSSPRSRDARARGGCRGC
jgi:hypothetical protein